MGSLAVIGTFYHRPWAIPTIAKAIREQTRQPDELWLLYEAEEDGEALRSASFPGDIAVVQVPVPEGVIPPAHQINVALDRSEADYVTYLTDDSLPLPRKYEAMVAAMDGGAEAVYCSQEWGRVESPAEWLAMPRGGMVRHAREAMARPFCVVDHTQVAHRRSDDRWPTAMSELRYSDGRFFERLVATLGPLQPIGEVLDWTRQLPDGISAR